MISAAAPSLAADVTPALERAPIKLAAASQLAPPRHAPIAPATAPDNAPPRDALIAPATASDNAPARDAPIASAGSTAAQIGPAKHDVFNAPLVPTAASAARPRVALVLSGGGARGFAHIGVLRVLREMHVPIDIVVGTSMGGVVGGAYAAGASVDELENMARNTDWDRVVADRPARDSLAFRRREEDLLLPSRIEFGVRGDGVSLPPAAAGNAALEQALARLLPPGTRDTPVSQLALPFRSVASDLLTGEQVDLIDTPLFLTLRASLAVPGVFAPVRVRERLVVDGGLVRNLPVDIAHAMGAQIVIAVNVGTSLAPEKELGSAVGVAQQMINILTEQNVQRSLQQLQPQDILVAPDLTGLSFLDFRHVEQSIQAGEMAARALTTRLAPLALPAEQYAAYEARRLAAPALADRALPLGRIDMEVEGTINPKALEVQTGLAPGQQITHEQLRVAADSLYGRGDVARVETDVSDVGGTRNVHIKATEDDWASSRLRVGLELASDFADSNSFGLKLMYLRSSINSWGGELRTVLGVGDQRALGAQWWQPLGPGAKWYAALEAQYSGRTNNLFSEGRRLARLGYNVQQATLSVGREFGGWGDLRAGVARQRTDVSLLVPEDAASPPAHAFSTTRFVRYRIDTLDSLGFPSRGYLLDANVESMPTGVLGSSMARFSVIGLAAVHTDAWAGHLYGEWAHAGLGSAPISLGGFMRLSGSAAESIDGRSIAFARLVLARRIGVMPITLGGTVRAGFSIEAGGGFDREKAIVASSFRQAGSVFLSVDTRFGPTYLGAGATRNGEKRLYLFLGPVW